MAYGPINARDYGDLINGAALSGNPTTGAVRVEGYTNLALMISLTHGTATDVKAVAAFSYSSDPAKFYDVQSVDYSVSPAFESSDAEWIKAVSGDVDWIIDIPLNCAFAKIDFSGTAATTDTITVRVRADAA